MSTDRERTTLAFGRGARLTAALGALGVVGILALLGAVLISLEGTRSEIRTTRERAEEAEARFERVTGKVEPLLEAVQPLATASAGRELRRTTREVAKAAGEVPALADTARDATDTAATIATQLEQADLPGTLGSVRALLERSDLPATLSSVRALLDRPALAGLIEGGDRALSELRRLPVTSLARCDRLLTGSDRQAEGRVGCLLRTVPNLRALLRSLRRLNRISATTQVTTLGVLKQSLSVQQDTLKSVQSIDRKTIGPAPTPAAPPGFPPVGR